MGKWTSREGVEIPTDVAVLIISGGVFQLGSPVVPFCPFSFWVPLLKPNSRKKGTLIIKGLLGNPVKVYDLGVSELWGTLFWGPCNKDPTI